MKFIPSLRLIITPIPTILFSFATIISGAQQMPGSYTNPEYPYIRSPDQDAAQPVHHPVIIVGGGPAGLGIRD